jgi:hypothetical protein
VSKPKVLIIGHARHGKDTLAEYWRDEYGMTFRSSSMACCEAFIFGALRIACGYPTIEDCYRDRVNRRALWHDMISDYNKEDPARLGKLIVRDMGNDCYVGMRSKREVEACMSEGLFDLVVWVDALDRLPPEDVSSFDIDKSIADIVISNNGTFSEFHQLASLVGGVIFEGESE